MVWGRLFSMLTSQSEVYLIQRLLNNDRFHKIARATHRRMHKLKTGEDLPTEVERTRLDLDNSSKNGLYWKYFVEEVKNQLKGTSRK